MVRTYELVESAEIRLCGDDSTHRRDVEAKEATPYGKRQSSMSPRDKKSVRRLPVAAMDGKTPLTNDGDGRNEVDVSDLGETHDGQSARGGPQQQGYLVLF